MAVRLVMIALLAVSTLVPSAGETPGQELRSACAHGDAERVAALLQQGAPINEGDNRGRTPLIIAAFGDPAIVKLLLEHGADVNGVSKVNNSALGDAADRDKLENVRLLVAAGADINHVSNFSRTPLDMAAADGFNDVVAYLLENHARINMGDSSTDALFYALGKDRLSTAKLLLAMGASVTVPRPAAAKPGGWSALIQQAARTGDVELVDLMLDHGAKVDERDGFGQSALFLAASRQDRIMVDHLLDRGADPNLGNEDGYTPFMMSVTYLESDEMQRMVDHGANINAQAMDGQTALMLISAHGRTEAIRYLLGLKPSVNLHDKIGESALTYAEDRGAVAMTSLLTQAGATPQAAHIIPKSLREPLSPGNRWALAVGAIYAQFNGYSHDSLAADPDKKSACIRDLNEEWHVDNRDQLLAEIGELDRPVSGSEIAAEEMMFFSYVKSRGGFPAAWSGLWGLLHHNWKWQGRMNVAWNTVRAANLVRDGVSAGYLAEDEGWPLLQRNARLTQQAYGSWREMNEGFIESRILWDRAVNPDYDACAALLLNPKEANSPWNQVAWNTDLGK